jgi:hypothetical protein
MGRVRCADVKNRVEHPPHWHTVMAGNIVVAGGECDGYDPAAEPPKPPRELTTLRIEQILRSRTYDEHAYDETTFQELLDEIDDVVKQLIADLY